MGISYRLQVIDPLTHCPPGSKWWNLAEKYWSLFSDWKLDIKGKICSLECCLWNYPQVHVTRLHWRWVNIGSGTAPSHYQNQCWPSYLTPYAVTRPQWVKHVSECHLCFFSRLWCPMPPLIRGKISFLVTTCLLIHAKWENASSSWRYPEKNQETIHLRDLNLLRNQVRP